MNPLDTIWQEKYRPKKVKDIVGNFKDKITSYLKNPQSLPHFLFYSRVPGTGKTSLSKAIINELGCDSLIINSSDDRKIETIRDKVKVFAMTKSTNNIRRCVLLDECDGMNKISQEALRNLMETYSSNVFFILTANAINKIVEPLQSRCVLIEFSLPDKKEIYTYLENICKQENLNYTEDGLNYLIEINYPSIRNCVKSLQDLFIEKKNVTKDNIKPANQIFDDVWVLLLQKKWMEIKRIVMEQLVDPRDLNKFFWEKCINMDEPNLKILQVCCRNERDFSYGCDPNVIFVSSLPELMR